ESVVVFGCGGLGLACVMIALAAGAEMCAVDVSPAALSAAEALGATALPSGPDIAAQVRERTGGGAHVSLDALRSPRPPAPRSSRCARGAGTSRWVCCWGRAPTRRCRLTA